MNDIKVVFMGTPDFAVPILQGLIDNYKVIGVVSQPDKFVGRHHVLEATPIKKLAQKYDIAVFQPEKIRIDYQDILDLEPDIIVTCAYGQIIPKEILDFPKYGCINVHASLLPKLRGGAPIHRAIIDGYSTTGITIMYMDTKMDNGDIISQQEIEIFDTDNLEKLHDKLSFIGKELLLDTLPSILNGTNDRTPQIEEDVTFAYNIKREEEHIDFSKTSREIFNLVRGLSPIPGANVILDDQEFKIYNCVISDRKFNDTNYGIITGLYKEGMGVSTLDGEIIITDLKPFGKKRMSASSYINGLRNNDMIGKVLK